MSISVREHDPKKEKPKVDTSHAGRPARKKRYDAAKKYRAEVDAEGAPKAVVFQRIVAQFDRASAGTYWECKCGHNPWAWQTECPRCGESQP